jgi:putative glycosyl hydrolase-like family 15 (GHL15) protein
MPATRPAAVIAMLVLLLALPAAGSALPGAGAGSVRFVKNADASFDRYTRAPNAATKAFMRTHYWRLAAHSPYFDSRLSWAPGTWVYQDAYAVYPGSPEAEQHPDWILRDASGNKLWIQFACGGGRCTQYAGDVGNPAFRAWWIRTARDRLAAGYRGIFIDDVNMAERISNGDGAFTVPIDPRTRRPIDERAWQHQMAAFMAQVRAAFPHAEIVHNVIWPVGDENPDLRRELDAANYIELERGFNDAGIVGGSSKFGFRTLLTFIAHRHAEGKGVVLDAAPTSTAERLYGLAAYFLVSNGKDAIADDAAGTPDTWWRGYDVRLGAPRTYRYRNQGVWRRDFADGTVLVNEPGAPTARVTVPRGLRVLNGAARRVVTLGPASGVVLVRGAADRRP